MTATTPEHDDDTDLPEPAGPIIGRRGPDRVPGPAVDFTIPSYDSHGRETLHALKARFDDLDGATVAAISRKKNTGGEIISILLSGMRKVLCDDDGISANESVRPVVDRDGQWVDVEHLPDGDKPHWTEARFVVGDQTDWATADEAIEHGRVHGSSKRRFEHLFDPDCLDIVDQSVLEGMLDLLISGGGVRPTSSSRASRRSRQTKKTRSGAG